MAGAALDFGSRRRAPVVLQSEAAECGLACLAMVAGFHGYETDLATMRRKHSMSLKGTTLAQLVRIAGRFELAARAVRLELDELASLALPAVLHWDFNHFVVLAAVKRGGAVIHDPVSGRRTVSLAELSKRFTGVALELKPTDAFAQKSERRRLGLAPLVGRLRGAGGALAQVLLISAALEIFALVAPLFMQLVVDHALVAADRDLIVVLGAGFLLLALVRTAVTAARSWVVLYIGTSLNLHLVTRLFGHLLRLPTSFFDRRHLGDVMSRFESLNVVQRTLTTSFIEAIVDGAMALVTLAMMCIYSWRLALIVCGAGALYALLRLVLVRPLRQASEEQIQRGARQQSNFLETVRGVQSIKLFGRQETRRALYQNLAVEQFNAGVRVQKLSIWFHALNGAIFGIENVAVIWLGAMLVLDGGFSVGMLFAFVAYKQLFVARAGGLVDKAIEFKMLGLHTERVADIALADVEPESDPVEVGGEAPSADIEVRSLSVRYSESDPLVLQNVNLEIREGESVAIVGPSGCGKSTLLKAMLGLLPTAAGEVRVGGVSLARMGTERYREMVGTVMQDDQLLAGSIADNICFFDPAPDPGRVRECAAMAAVHADIAAMPMGYNTPIGDMGAALSGGQKQRILLARALYKRPRILFLDEATSHLDVHRESQVNEAIRALRITRVIVAHRPETIASADRVILLGNGAPRAACVTGALPWAA